MPDPWVEGEELEEHEAAVEDHYLTAQAKDVREQNKELAQAVADERQDAEFGSEEAVQSSPKPAQEGKNADAVTGGQGTSGEATAPEPAGNVDSQETKAADKRAADEKAAADQKAADKKAADKK